VKLFNSPSFPLKGYISAHKMKSSNKDSLCAFASSSYKTAVKDIGDEHFVQTHHTPFPKRMYCVYG